MKENYTGFWVRFAASFIDLLIIIFFFCVPLFYVLNLLTKDAVFAVGSLLSSTGLISPWIIPIVFLYYVITTHFYGATFGKMAVGCKVTAIDGSRLSLGQVVLREVLGKFINSITLNIGYLIAAFTPQKRGLHDYIAKSVVTYTDPESRARKWVVITVLTLQFLALLLF